MDKKKTVAVTGASGMIGYHVCKALIAHGFGVRALVNTLPDYLKVLPLVFVYGDVLDPSSLRRLVADADYVIHLAAKISLRSDKTGHTRRVNIEGGGSNPSLRKGPSECILPQSEGGTGLYCQAAYKND